MILVDSATDPRYQGGCPAGGTTFLHVDNMGDISPCPLIPYPVGNLSNMTMGEAIAMASPMVMFERLPTG